VTPAGEHRIPGPAYDTLLRAVTRLGVRERLLIAFPSLVLVVVALVTVFHMSAIADFTVRALVVDGEVVARQVYDEIASAMKSHPNRSAESSIRSDRALSTLLKSSKSAYPLLQDVAVVSDKGRVLAHSAPTFVGETMPERPEAKSLLALNPVARLLALQKDTEYEVVLPLQQGTRNVGTIRVGLSSHYVRDALGSSLRISLLLAGLSLVIALVLAVALADLIAIPLKRLAEGIQRIGRGELTTQLESPETGDMGELFSSFNTMSQRLAEDRNLLEERDLKLTALVDGLEDAVLLVERSGRVAHANPAACRALARTESELVGADVTSTLGVDHPLVDLWRTSQASGRSLERGGVRLDSDPRGDRHLLLASPLGVGSRGQAPAGQRTAPAGVVLTLRNSDSLRRLTSLVDESHRMLQWGQVALGVAHEIKNPLQAMNLNLELAREKIGRVAADVDMSGPQRNLGVVAQQIHRLDDVVNSFLRFARMTHAEREPLNVNGVLSEVVSLVASEAEAQGVTIKYAPKPGLPAVHGDRGLLYQAFLNLVQNSIQAGPHRGPIEIGIEQDSGRGLVVTVRDHGRGIARADRERVFELFFTTREHGSGIGLPIVQRVLQLHGGTLDLDSEEGRGTTFRVFLPFEAALPVSSLPPAATLAPPTVLPAAATAATAASPQAREGAA
jgi:signal transduction histidine kinase/HAMP domain-containing protein